ncbi:ATP-binding protein [Acetobacterium wieringae]|uniref:ATP-binding protein n=1 Tax=Acetobacterium wieringae TaxID=52694 RepID=UPI00203391C9|nr:ATP-binding protein [Acetobacterium wieringae]URN85173.1 ATP-binding protein [Acetobacterium wieringae]
MEIIKGKLLSAQKIAIYGPEGIGKSTFAAQFPNVLFIDTEGSTKHMDVARTPKPSSWQMLLDQVQYVKQNPTSFQTLAIDTADWAEQLCITSICAKHQKQGIEDFGYGKGYIYLAEEFGRLLNKLEELVEMGINVVVTAHAKMRKFEQPDEMGAYDRWELKLQKQTGPLLKEWADMVLFANYKTTVVNVDGQGANKGKNKAQGGKRVMFTTHHPCWDAKNRHNLPLELPFDFLQIVHCLPGMVATPPTQVATVKEEPKVTVTPTEQPKEESKVDATKMLEDEGFTEIIEPEQQEMKVTENPNISNDYQVPEGIPKSLADLMKEKEVTELEIQEVVAKKKYFPKDTPIRNYPIDFIEGVLVQAWPQVFAMIDAERVPF